MGPGSTRRVFYIYGKSRLLSLIIYHQAEMQTKSENTLATAKLCSSKFWHRMDHMQVQLQHDARNCYGAWYRGPLPSVTEWWARGPHAEFSTSMASQDCYHWSFIVKQRCKRKAKTPLQRLTLFQQILTQNGPHAGPTATRCTELLWRMV